MNKSVDIYQIYFKPEQKASLSEDAKHYFNKPTERSFLCEHVVFQDAYKNGLHLSADFTGFVSWKFEVKSHVTIQQFKNFINENPGYDVYFINPFPDGTSFRRNIWTQGELCHPGIIHFAEKIIKEIKLDSKIDFTRDILPDEASAFCNFWVGNSVFWESYMEFLTPIYEILDKLTIFSKEEKEKLTLNAATDYTNMPYHTFILERFFTTFLLTNKYIKYKAFPIYEKEYLLSRYSENMTALFFIADEIKNSFRKRTNLVEVDYKHLDEQLRCLEQTFGFLNYEKQMEKK